MIYNHFGFEQEINKPVECTTGEGFLRKVK